MKNIIITGTSRGIGFELALAFASQGYQVLALSRSIPEALQVHSNITCISVDLTLEEEFTKIHEFITLNWTSVDVLINNAGALLNKPFEGITYAEFEYIYKVNVFAVSRIIQIAIPFMSANSHVVTISSMGGIQGSMKFPGLAAYSSSKGAVITLSELLAEEYKDRLISFNVLALGAVQTEMLEEAFPGYQANTSAKQMADYIFDFALTGHKYYNGKVLQVSSSTP